MEKSSPVYRPLLDPEQYDGRDNRGAARRHYRRPASMVWCLAAQVLLFLASVITLGIAYRVSKATASPQECATRLSTPSPALAAVHDEYESRRFMGTIGGASPYMGRPTDERIEEWRKLQRSNAFRLTHDELLAAGASEHSVQWPEEDGGGYMAVLEVYHHIHCVEELWKHTWPDFYDPRAANESHLYRHHLDHCADMLRQKLMCDGDVTPLTFSWVKGISHPVLNFNAMHKCRNFDDIREWSRDNAVPTSRDWRLHKPADVFELEGLP